MPWDPTFHSLLKACINLSYPTQQVIPHLNDSQSSFEPTLCILEMAVVVFMYIMHDMLLIDVDYTIHAFNIILRFVSFRIRTCYKTELDLHLQNKSERTRHDKICARLHALFPTITRCSR